MPLELNGTTGVQGNSGAFVAGTAVASTSGTSIDFTSIPSWVKRITVNAMGVSTNGSSDWGIRLGTSGGIVSTGYSGSVANSSAGFQTPTTYAQTVYSTIDTLLASGSIIINLANPSTNTWTIAGTLGTTTYGRTMTSGFFVALSGALTTVRITTGNGTDAFDAGSINILYEQTMNRIEIDVITGTRQEIELTAEEVAQAQAQYQEWLAAQPTKEEQIAKLQAQIDALKDIA